MSVLFVRDRQGEAREIAGEPGVSVMEILRDYDLGIEAICGGMCSCATCHVYVDDNWLARLPEQETMETALLEELRFYKGEYSRLSCQIPFSDELNGLSLTIAPNE